MKLGNVYCVTSYTNDMHALQEVIHAFKINVQLQNLFSRCMICNGDDFLVASKLQMIRLKYQNVQIPKSLSQFVRQEEEYSKIIIPDTKIIRHWKPFNNEKVTKSGAKIEIDIPEGTLRSYQTFYICNGCAKLYWDGAHSSNFRNKNGGKFDFIFDLFPEANDDN